MQILYTVSQTFKKKLVFSFQFETNVNKSMIRIMQLAKDLLLRRLQSKLLF